MKTEKRSHAEHMRELRKKAEERLNKSEDAARLMSKMDLRKLVHELGVYHVELQMQNEELMAAEAMLTVSREKYYSLFDFAPVAFFRLDEFGIILEANRAGLGLLGLSASDLTNVQTFSLFVNKDDRAAFRSLTKASTLKGGTYGVIRLKSKGGEEYTVQLTGTASETNDGKPGVMLAAADITPLIEAEAEKKIAELAERKAVEEAEQLRTQRLENLQVLAGGIAHDLNNMMVAVLANTELAMKEINPDSKAAEYVMGIDTSAARVAGLARQILSYTGKEQAVKETLDVNTVARDTTGLLIATLPRDAKLEYDIADGPLVIDADYQNLQQVMMNLIINAGESLGGREGVIRISTGKVDAGKDYLEKVRSIKSLSPGPYCYFEVSDTGSGMHPETVTNLFEAFYTTKKGGRGLGMSVVARVAELHGGGIDVDTEPGKGTRIRLLIPASAKKMPDRQEHIPASKALRGSGTILLVDDDPTVLRITCRILENAGYRVLTAVDGNEAIGVFREHADDIAAVVMDYIMPGMHGDITAREIRKIRKDEPIILLSGYHEFNIEDLEKGPGKTQVLGKPCRSSELVGAIQDIVRR